MVFPDFAEFIACLNANRVRYLVVGGYAVGFHARPRATKDIDILLDRRRANARRACTAIVLRFVKVEPLTLAIAKAAGEALATTTDVDARLTIDAQVMATAAVRGGVVITQDVADLEQLRAFFPSVRILAV